METFEITYCDIDLVIEATNHKAEPEVGYRGELEIYKIYVAGDHTETDLSQILMDKVVDEICTMVIDKYELL